MRLIDDARHGCGRHLGLAGNIGDEQGWHAKLPESFRKNTLKAQGVVKGFVVGLKRPEVRPA
jgi:hypothetical protein